MKDYISFPPNKNYIMKTVKMQKVLIALDYDPTAKKVAEAGYSLSKTMGAEVTLLHVVSDPLHYNTYKHIKVMGFAGYNDTVPLILEGMEELKQESQKFLDKSKLYLGDKSIKTTIGEGDPAESILMTAKKIKADIIVMGSHSWNWIEKIVMGSVTEKVLNFTTIPLFIVPVKKKK